jgi:hypothetical protein
MAATISVNFANEQDVYDESLGTEPLRSKKSVSAKLLSDVLGGGVVSGGYVQRTGSSMTGYLTLTSVPPIENFHAATKKYVDDHAYTRRYYYECRVPPIPGNGFFVPGTNVLSGTDVYTNPLYFFDRGDQSLEGITRYLDVYRDGILQVFGQDYEIINNFGSAISPGVTAIRFFEPFEQNSTFQVNIGNTGAFPLTFGVSKLSGGYGMEYTGISGDLTSYVTPSSFAASSLEVSLSTEPFKFVSPKELSAHPMVIKGIGLFIKDSQWNIESNFKSPLAPYGSQSGEFLKVDSKKILSIKSDPENTGVSPGRFRVTFELGIVKNINYNAVVNINTNSFNPDDICFATVNLATRTLTSFDFFVYDVFGSNPEDVVEISTLIY